ncbi:F0F1 ATP synthase subunit delta [Bombilactobacillus bombi]|uniref:ATP synthase F1 subunit delta n=1 Tax=Bombilactobacillus bombi TaxID=1303590 RepID=UPI000E5862C0|nr:ATP synthase F1 subunit delta [Bombilactobacillus bombi]AXX64684.1 F0F1 ATP synthase subunit delta [Bombilactobacillus bombi]
MPAMKLSSDEIGRRYGKALFEFAQEQNQKQAILEELQALTEIYRQVPDLGAVLTDARLSTIEKQKILTTLTNSASKIMQNFLKLAFEYRRLNAIPEITAAYEKLYDESTGTYDATITSAVKLNSQQVENLKKALTKRISAKTINITMKIDPSIIGGVIVQVGSQIIDGSIATRIRGINRVLLND